ncbi:hypothetical protein A2U01_0106427, partial [Trifolium medium]|nr:hypothetical protein [Trifolium medium]
HVAEAGLEILLSSARRAGKDGASRQQMERKAESFWHLHAAQEWTARRAVS